MTYEKAANALVTAGLLDSANVGAAVSALGSSTVEFTYPAWATALAKAGLIDSANVGAAADVIQQAGVDEATDDPDGFEKGLEDAGIL